MICIRRGKTLQSSLTIEQLDDDYIAHHRDEMMKIIKAADSMTTEEAVRYLTHGPEMESVLRDTLQILFRDTACPDAHSKIWQLIAKMERRDGE
jgi:hypothetical protein